MTAEGGGKIEKEVAENAGKELKRAGLVDISRHWGIFQ